MKIARYRPEPIGCPADIQFKKRKREGAELNGDVRTDDMLLDEGEIPADAHHDTGLASLVQ